MKVGKDVTFLVIFDNIQHALGHQFASKLSHGSITPSSLPLISPAPPSRRLPCIIDDIEFIRPWPKLPQTIAPDGVQYRKVKYDEGRLSTISNRMGRR